MKLCGSEQIIEKDMVGGDAECRAMADDPVDLR